MACTDKSELWDQANIAKNKWIKSSLTFLGKEFDIDHDYEKLHNAIVDLELNLKVWNRLKYSLQL